MRRIIQIMYSPGAKGEPHVLALCDDSTLWSGEDLTGIMRWTYVSTAGVTMLDKSIVQLETIARDTHAAGLVKDVDANSLAEVIAGDLGRHPEAAE